MSKKVPEKIKTTFQLTEEIRHLHTKHYFFCYFVEFFAHQNYECPKLLTQIIVSQA